MDKDPGLGMLRGERVTIDCNSPPLIHSGLCIPAHSIDHGRKLGAKQEDVDSAVCRDVIERFRHRISQFSSVKITDEVTININRSAALSLNQNSNYREVGSIQA